MDDNILVQGIIDLYFINEAGEVVLVDYKTDYVEKGKQLELVEKYRKQLEIYKKALEQALGKKVDKCFIYSVYLEELIAKREKQIGCDIVLVTIDESLYDIYGITEDTDYNWEWSITEYAESFFIDNGFGYNVAGQNGDGALLLHNWHPIEKGLHVTHGGRVWNHYSDSMISDLLDDIYYKAKIDPYEAYKYYIENMYREMSGQANKINLPPFILFIIAIVAATIFIATHMKSKEGSKTTTASTYVENGSVQFKVRTDQLVNKYVTSRVIQTSSSSGGSRSGGGRSSGGSRMGGGSRRG